jgi:hypothetical protein
MPISLLRGVDGSVRAWSIQRRIWLRSLSAYDGSMRWVAWVVAIVLLLGGVVAWGMMSPAPPPCRGFCVLTPPPHRLHTELALVLWTGGLVSLGAALRSTHGPVVAWVSQRNRSRR